MFTEPHVSSSLLPAFAGTDRFRVLRQLGAGGFGVVYEVVDRERDATVALKVLRRADPEHLYRLKQEFRALAEISHPNLVSFYELLSDNGRWFFTMELVSGTDFVGFVRGIVPVPRLAETKTTDSVSRATRQIDDVDPAADAPTAALSDAATPPTLPAVVAQSGLDFARLRQALKQLGHGLTYLHSLGKLHRDIKSANVMVTPEGRVVLLDFGLVMDRDAEISDPAMNVAGTLEYMAPEQFGGDGPHPAADWYAVGVLMFRALTARYPFNGNAMEMWNAKQRQAPPQAREFVPGLPEDLNALCRDLLAKEPARRPTGDQFLARLGASAPTLSIVYPVSAASRAPFVGRQAELRALESAYAAGKAGQATTVYLHGTSGIGKTALVRHFLEDLQRRDEDTLVFAGRCYEQESVPYKALDSLVDALSQYLRERPPSEVESVLPRDIAELARLFPVLNQVEAISAARHRARRVPESQELRRRAFAAFRELIDRISARRPVVMFIDDLQWGDADSAALLATLMLPPDPPPVLLLLSYRTEEASRVLLPTLLEHHRRPTPEGAVRELAIGELTQSESRELSRMLIGATAREAVERADTVAREARGNPFLIDELARYSLEHAETAKTLFSADTRHDELTVDAVVNARVQALPESARHLLEVLAVFGAPLNIGIARRAADVKSGELASLSVLRARRLIRLRTVETTEQIETYHDRIRETVVKQLSPAAAQTHHRRLAEALELASHPDPETLAIHFNGAGLRPRAAHYAVLAASQAGQALAFDRAARLYRFAIELDPSDGATVKRLRIELGHALAYAGRGYEAAQAYLAAADRADASLAQLELRRRAGEQLLRSGHIDDGFAVMKSVLHEIGVELESGPKRSLISLLWRRVLIRVLGSHFRERPAAEIAPLDLFKVDALWSVAVHVGMIDIIRGADFQARQLLLARRVGDVQRVARAVAAEVAYSAVAGTRSAHRTAKLLSIAEDLARRSADPQAIGFLCVMNGMAANMQGRWKDSFELARRAEGILRDGARGIAWELDLVYLYSLIDLHFMGELSELRRRLAQFLREARERDDLNAITNLRTRLGYLPHLASDDPNEARLEVIRGIRNWSQQGFQLQHYYAIFAQAEVMLYTGNGLLASRLVETQWADLRRSLILNNQNIRVEALHLRSRAALAAACESAVSDDRRRAFLRAAERHARRILREGAGWASGQADLVRAGIAATRGDVPEALEHLAASERACASADMNLHAAVARHRRGQLIGGDAGAALIAAAQSWMKSQDIRNTDRMTALLAPGDYPHQ